MKRILFICLGNICRSPMAEFIMKDLVKKAHAESSIYVASAATSDWERGNPVYPPAASVLKEHGLESKGKTVRLLGVNDYGNFDLLIGMERANIREIKSICGEDREGKVHLLREYAGDGRDIADPWYTRDFELCYKEIYEGCKGLLGYLQNTD